MEITLKPNNHDKKGKKKPNQPTQQKPSTVLHRTTDILQLHATKRQPDATLPQHSYLEAGTQRKDIHRKFNSSSFFTHRTIYFTFSIKISFSSDKQLVYLPFHPTGILFKKKKKVYLLAEEHLEIHSVWKLNWCHAHVFNIQKSRSSFNFYIWSALLFYS